MLRQKVNDVSGNEAVLEIERAKAFTSMNHSGIVAMSVIVFVFVLSMLIGLMCYMRQHHKKYGSYQFGTSAVYPTSIKKSDAVHRQIKIDNSRTFVCCTS